MKTATASILAALVLLFSGGAWAQWYNYGTPVCTADGNQGQPCIVSDGSGGAIIAWTYWDIVGESAPHRDVYTQRIDSDGFVKWAENGVALCTVGGEQSFPQIVSDGSGGAIVAWQDMRGTDWNIYAQRIAGDGSVLWEVNGEAICSANGDQTSPRVVSDGSGGAIVAWLDGRGAKPNVHVQRVDSNGSTAWTDNGIAICPSDSSQYAPHVVSDGAAGAIVAWSDRRNGDDDIRAQRIDGNGSTLWPVEGIAVCEADSAQLLYDLISDGSGGAFASWTDGRNGTGGIYVQRLDSNGSTLWTSDGVPVCTAVDAQWWPALASDGTGGAIIVWSDSRAGSAYGYVDLYAQRVDASGGAQWTADGTAVCLASGDQYLPCVVSDGAGGAIAMWWDQRYANDVFAQRVDTGGSTRWTWNGVEITGAGGYYQTIISDGMGGALVAWGDLRGHYNHIFAQRIERNGYWGYPSPKIVSIEDVPEDDGGFVRLTWASSRLDALPDSAISRYTLWREAAGIASNEGMSSWEMIGSKVADCSSQYTLVARTLGDSSAAGPGYARLRVVAETSDTSVFWTSAIDSGYSADNLPPMPVEGFAGAQSITPVGLNLSWDEDESPDVSYYSLHKEDEEGFAPDALNLVGTATATGYFDPGWSPANNTFYYKVLAVDEAGNKSNASLLRPQDITIGTLLRGFAASFFNGGIDVTWRLSEAGRDARFAVLRGEGRTGAFARPPGGEIESEGLSFAFRDDGVEPGSSYRYRVDVSDENGARTLFETEEIVIPEMPLTLYQNQPNPFNPSTSIRYYLPEDGRVVLDVFDVSGRRVALLVNDVQRSGVHALRWNGLNARGERVRSGVYFCTLRFGKGVLSRTMILLQ